MHNATLLASLVTGSLLPLLVAVVQRPHFPRPARVLVMLASSLVAGGVVSWANGELDSAADTAGAVLVVLIAAASTYSNVWRPAGIAPAVERATSPSSDELEVHGEA